eukprot:scaffold409_cov143-Skeletonema_menzelii.AAC.16
MAESPLLFYGSIILFAVISWAIYNYVLSGAGPTPSSSTTITAVATDGTNTTNGTTTTPPTTTAASTATNTTNATAAQSQNNQELLSSYHNFDQPKRHPPHLYNPTSKQLNPSTVETGGIIPFKLTFANGYETRLANQQQQQQQESDNNNNNSGEENLIITNRKQRARLFAKLFTIVDRPPNRGSNVVVIISYTGGGGGGGGGVSVAKCDKLQKSLMLLGTYYNLFLLVDYNPLQQQQQQQQQQQEEELDRDVVKQFRNDLLNVATTKPDDNDLSSNNNGSNINNNDKDKLTPQILPPHRIIFTSTPEGKIAFVRQLHETKLVLMGSSSKNNSEGNTMKVKVELERFGFRVVSYPDCHTGGDEGVSALGQFLIP